MHTIRIRFTKTGEASYISLLDLQRVMGRAFKRSGCPVWYTLGFNPHVYMTFACPLPLGQESLVECVDCKTEEEAPDLPAWQAALNRVMPSGIEVTRVYPADKKAEEIAFARYTVRCDGPGAQAALDGYNAAESALVEKKTKRGVKTIDLKEHLPQLTGRAGENGVTFEMTLPASNELNLNPALLLGFLQQQWGLRPVDCHVLRTALLTKNREDF